MESNREIETAEVMLPCTDLDENLEFFTGRLGFQIDSIFPADNPAVAVIFGHGLRIRLEKRETEETGSLSITIKCKSPEKIAGGFSELKAPNGVVIELTESNPEIRLPELIPALVITKNDKDSDWIQGRAGMRYRDLIPDRQGGRFIASHIHVPDAGPVPDYVHFHKIRFQMIYCYKGWVKLVYEDQGEPFILNAGDCVLQPPEIRHRVLESSENLEVIELSSPAEHETIADHELELPNATVDPDREFGGQSFVRHVAAEADWEPWRIDGFEYRDTGIGDATAGLAGARVARRNSDGIGTSVRHEAEFVFMFVLTGKITLEIETKPATLLEAGDSIVIPSGIEYRFSTCSDDHEMLEVTIPATLNQPRNGKTN